jgi:ketol-acid reductoisomerase
MREMTTIKNLETEYNKHVKKIIDGEYAGVVKDYQTTWTYNKKWTDLYKNNETGQYVKFTRLPAFQLDNAEVQGEGQALIQLWLNSTSELDWVRDNYNEKSGVVTYVGQSKEGSGPAQKIALKHGSLLCKTQSGEIFTIEKDVFDKNYTRA